MTNQTASLRDQIAEALMSWAERNANPQHATLRRPETVRQNAYGRADAVLAVLAAAGIRDAARQATAQPATEAVCACGHAAHAPGTECEDGVNHGRKRWHRFLCLNLIDANSACPPDMDCQGGTLGYSDMWHRQRAAAPNAALGITTEQALHGAAALGAAIRAARSSGSDLVGPSVGRQDTQPTDTVRNTIEHALTTYYQHLSAPGAIARALLAQHDASVLSGAADRFDEDSKALDLQAALDGAPELAEAARHKWIAAGDLRRLAAEAAS